MINKGAQAGLITSAFVLGSVFCLSFGNSLQPISALAFLRPLLSLISYDRLVLITPVAWAGSRPRLWHSVACIFYIVMQAIGLTVAFGGEVAFIHV